jgi:mevalonate kinase
VLHAYQCPGKVILLGEYSVLVGGQAIVGALKPEFELKVHRTDSYGIIHTFAPESPAGRLITRAQAQHGDTLGGVRLEWIDPYRVPIGVGSSSAQFILAYRALHDLLTMKQPDTGVLLEDYWETVGSSQGLRPSGADVVAQNEGGVIVFRNHPYHLRKLDETPFAGQNVSLWLAFTGSKMRTHEHLKQLAERGFPVAFTGMIQTMEELVVAGLMAWRAGDAPRVGDCFNRYQDVMNKAALSEEPVVAEITRAREWPGVLGCKGSGAQGGDSVLFLIEDGSRSQLETRCHALGWELYPVRF